MATTYSARFENVTITNAVQDLLSIVAGSANPLRLLYANFSAGGQSAASEIRVNFKRLPATVTAGSVGSALTKNPLDSGNNKTATATVRVGDTTQATTSGTAANLQAWEWNMLAPLDVLPTPEIMPRIQASEGLVFELAAAPGAAISMSGFVVWEEA